MGRLIFNSDMGIVGVRGRLAHSMAYHAKGTPAGKLVHYGGAYSRKDIRGVANVLCKYPTSLFSKNATAAQQAIRQKFTDCWSQVTAILADPQQLATYETAFKRQNKYVVLRNFIFAQLWNVA